MTALSIDFETRSRIDLRKAGAYRYAEDPSTDVLCMAFAFGDEEVELWTPGAPTWHTRIEDHVLSGGEIRAWNAAFERIMWAGVLGPKYGFPIPKLEQFVDTAAEAAAMALPRQLAKAARVLNIPDQIAEDKHRLILQMSKPRKPTKKDPREWWDEAEKFQQLYDACKQDVRAERAIAHRLRRLSEHERQVYLLDQRMNDRGVMLDVPLIKAAQRMVAIGMDRANADMDRLTSGTVSAVTQVGQIKRWLQAQGVETDDIRKNTLRDLLAEGDVQGAAREVIELRSSSAKSSTAKLNAMKACVCADGRARGQALYHGAGTGRWAGRLIQVQNFPRTSDPVSGQPTVDKPERFIPLVLKGEYDLIESEYPTLVVISVLLRSMLRAAPGHKFMAGDYSGIEARVLAWIAEQTDLVFAFATGDKLLYERMAAFIQTRKLGREVRAEEIAKESPERQIGKNTILGAGFGMGWKTFQTQVQVQTGVVISDEDAKIAIESYRELYSCIRAFWYAIEKAAIAAVKSPGTVTCCGRGGAIRYVVKGKFLWCMLPSGRPLCYALPKIEQRTVPWGRCKKCGVDKDKHSAVACSSWESCTTKDSLSFWGVDGYTKQWKKHYAYGGFLCENVVQAMARDLLASAMLRLENKHGYPCVLTVHDEDVCEVPDDFGSLEQFLALMKVRPKWAEGLPVGVDGWTGERYRK